MAVQVQPFNFAVAVTKSDTANIQVQGRDRACDALYVGTASTGNVVVVLENDSTVTFNVGNHQQLDIKAKRVNSTGTAASDIVALFIQ